MNYRGKRLLEERTMEKLVILQLLVLIATACAWENEETLYPGSGLCDTLDVSYSEDVVPILANSCYECHSKTNAPDFGNGLTLEDYEDVFASSDLVVGAINHQEGFPAMPQEADKLDTCSISVIEAWVNSGAPDN
jgi:hypothetical protein